MDGESAPLFRRRNPTMAVDLWVNKRDNEVMVEQRGVDGGSGRSIRPNQKPKNDRNFQSPDVLTLVSDLGRMGIVD